MICNMIKVQQFIYHIYKIGLGLGSHDIGTKGGRQIRFWEGRRRRRFREGVLGVPSSIVDGGLEWAPMALTKHQELAAPNRELVEE
jgi:hypothetical protein